MLLVYLVDAVSAIFLKYIFVGKNTQGGKGYTDVSAF